MTRRSGRFSRWSVGMVALLVAASAVPVAAQTAGESTTSPSTQADGTGGTSKPPFSPPKFSILPADPDAAIRSYVKQNHWHTGQQTITSNDEDFQGRSFGRTAERTGRLVSLPGSPYVMTSDRTAALPKGQAKSLQLTYFVPTMPRQEGRARPKDPGLEFLLQDRRGVTRIEAREPGLLLQPHQHLLVILSSPRERYGFFKVLPSIVPPYDEFVQEERPLNFQVVLGETNRRIGLPSHATTWTTISHILLDGIDPNLMTLDQQDALTDWLHLGGQLIVSGPDQLDLLRGSFLEPFLPVRKTASRELTQADLDPLSEYWTLPEKKYNARRTLVVGTIRSVLGAELELVRSEGNVSPPRWVRHTGDLVAERAVGRGRVTVTAFPIAARPLIAWPHYDGFINAVLLRRPARSFTQTADLGIDVGFTDFRRRTTDPSFGSAVRLFSRDVPADALIPGLRAQAASAPPEDEESDANGPRSAMADPFVAIVPPDQIADPAERGYGFDAAGGPASWTDRGGVSQAARDTLRDATAISVPDRSFVFRMMAIYLVLLVPVNYVIFRLIGRVEWAWIAAPVLAIGAAVAVVQAAQLDIGFARSRSELIIVEGFGDYDRAYLTRYTSLYTSLSSRYAFQFDDPSAIAAPLTQGSGTVNLFEQTREIRLVPERGVRLEGFSVDSNSVGTVHSEQCARLGGRVRLFQPDPGDETASDDGTDREDRWQVTSDLPLTLQDVGLVRADRDGVPHFAPVGTLATGDRKALTWTRLDQDQQPSAFATWASGPVYRRPAAWGRPASGGAASSTDANLTDEGNLRLWRPFLLATEQLRLAPGEVRLIGWTDDEFEGLTITPSASQNTIRAFMVLHLAPPAWPDPVRDRNALGDYQVAEEKKEEAGMSLFGREPLDAGSPGGEARP